MDATDKYAPLRGNETIAGLKAEIERLKAENQWLYDQLAAQREAYRELVSRRALEGK